MNGDARRFILAERVLTLGLLVILIALLLLVGTILTVTLLLLLLAPRRFAV